MSYTTLIEEVEAALIAFATDKLSALNVKQISALTAEDFSEDDRIVTETPAVRFLLRSEDLTPGADAHRLTYESAQTWIALCGQSRPSTLDKERAAAQSLVSQMKNALAGARLPLPSNQTGAIVALSRIDLYQLGPEGTWYAISFQVESVTQFEANMN